MVFVTLMKLNMSQTFRPARGFTLLELLVAILIISIVGLYAVEIVASSVTNFYLDGASYRLLEDLRYARHMARVNGGWYGVSANVNPTNTYTVYVTDGTTDTPLANPAAPNQNMIVDLKSTYHGVTLSNVSIAGGSKVEFNSSGIPYNDKNGSALVTNGTITLSTGTRTRTITISKNTGTLTQQ